MNSENHASYEASSFCVDASKLEFDNNGQITKEDFPAFLHEWWHYMQDVTTITGQNGFYLWMRDIVRMTSITCKGDGKVITLPLERDKYEEFYSKYRRLYNIFCGEKEERRFADFKIMEAPSIAPQGISFDGEDHVFAKCEIKIGHETFYFGLIALQELNAFYAQQIAESYLPGVKFNVPAESLPEFPYKVGDALFDYYKVECNLKTKFMITYLVLDSLQAPCVLLHLLKELSGRSINYEHDRKVIITVFQKVSAEYSHSNPEAVGEWIKDYTKWINDPSHLMLKDSLTWYIGLQSVFEKQKKDCGIDTFALALCLGLDNLNKLYSCFPAPLIKRGDEVLGQTIKDNEQLSEAAQHDFEYALVIWSHRRIYDLLKSQDRKSFNENTKCPLYNDGKCPYLKFYHTDKSYDCNTAPWMVVKGEKQALCPYAVAAHSMGLWQNDLDFNF